MVKLLEQSSNVAVHWVVFSSDETREREARSAADALLAGASSATVEIGGMRERYLPYEGARVKERFDRLGVELDPDLVFTHFRHDLHQDHRLLSELTYNTFRDHLVLEYEIPKIDGDLGSPNAFVHLTESHCEQKISTLLETFTSQREKHWFTAETFRALLRIRGIESRSPTGLAEGFYCRKVVLA
jgi:LmbE family N-acetylglucosaminyl deacetylase